MTLLFGALAVQKALEERILPELDGIEVVFDPTLELVRRIDEGARPDVLIAVSRALVPLAERDIVEASGAQVLGAVGMGLAVAAGAPAPEIRTTETFVAALLAARSVAYSQAGASGIYLRDLLLRLGVLEEVAARATVLDKGFTARAIVDGRADLAIQQVSELAYVSGVEIVGPLPRELQTYTEFSVAVRPGADAAARFVARRLADDDARRAYRESGFER